MFAVLFSAYVTHGFPLKRPTTAYSTKATRNLGASEDHLLQSIFSINRNNPSSLRLRKPWSHLYSEFRAVDNLVARNTACVLKAFQNARVGSHAVQLGSREHLLAFCEAVQRSSPVISSFTKPIAGATPGYASEVIFADGTFIDGSTSELSCDGPLREPFAVFCQVINLRSCLNFSNRVTAIGLSGDYF